jgi:hypothetical protein
VDVTVFLWQPVHAGLVLLQVHHPVGSGVDLPGLRVAGDHHGHGYELVPVLRPKLGQGEPVDVDIVPFIHDLLARCFFHFLGEVSEERGEGEDLIRHGGIHEGAPDSAFQVWDGSPLGRGQGLRNLLLDMGEEVFGPEGPGHPLVASEEVAQHGQLRSLHVFKEYGRSLSPGQPVDDCVDLEDRVHFPGHPNELTFLVQHFHEFPEVIVDRHGLLLPGRCLFA